MGEHKLLYYYLLYYYYNCKTCLKTEQYYSDGLRAIVHVTAEVFSTLDTVITYM